MDYEIDSDIYWINKGHALKKQKTYKIIRFFKDDNIPSRIIREGLTLQEAREHCQDEETRGENFFDGYEEE